MSGLPKCESCLGTGEQPTDSGPFDCPDCGGSGYLPSRSVLVDWRSRDIERLVNEGKSASAVDVKWLLAELRSARAALTDIIALAHDAEDADGISKRIRFVANRALGLYETYASSASSDESRAAPSRIT